MPDADSNMLDWRPLIAAIAHDDTRTVFAQIVLGERPDLGDSLRRIRATERCVDTLRRAGVLDSEGAVDGGFLRRILVTSAPPKATGVERFLSSGRIVQYPANPDERARLLEYVASHALQPGEVINEQEMNERLRAFHPDVAALRRYLVDFEFVERTSSGTEYALVTDHTE
ncbi:DUF2087 domain-containing protein [Plantibacter auratus]|uniref:DUF2087 domain-containing protein n=1 Tax=Plantibacter auratus TaxID=272914 RepID=UPI003D358D57